MSGAAEARPGSGPATGLPTPRTVERIYLGLLFGNTLAASLIWGINTIFLLDAGLTNFEAFAANAFFTAGMVVFEVPTGVVADTAGRRRSYLLGTVTLSLSTLLYVLLWQVQASFWLWAVVSMLLGLGFTFFSGAVGPGWSTRCRRPASTAISTPSSAGARWSPGPPCSAARRPAGSSPAAAAWGCRSRSEGSSCSSCSPSRSGS